MAEEIVIVDLIIGVILSIICGLFFGLGIILQKKAVSSMEDIKLTDTDSLKNMVKNRTWLLGVGLSLLGGVPYIGATIFIGVALVQPLTLGLQLAFTVFFAIKMLEEKLQRIEIIGFSLLLSSPVFLALGFVTPPDVDVGSSAFIISLLLFIIPFIIICVVFYLLVKKFKENDTISGLLAALVSGILFAMGATMNQLGVEIFKGYIDLFIFGIICYVIMMLNNTLATGIQQIAFQKGETSVGIAIALQAMANLFLAVFGGVLIFNQAILSPIFYITGIALIVLGNILLVQFQVRVEKIDDSTHVPSISKQEENE